jgi:D-beta-D-heptose 7-phosphate kinase/D-beta-D-heptose 1-phosphate adenosyltransferase
MGSRKGAKMQRNAKSKRPFAVYDLRSYNFSLTPMGKKILTRDELLIERQDLREAGKKLVFTNGVFDILHVGHVRYLQQARELGDALVVAVNSDRSVRELKGDTRPVMNENDRAEILASLAVVDVSPRSLIAELLPDVLVKGGDYSLDQIHGREEVEAAGGSVVSLPFVNGISTSNILERLMTRKDSHD